MTKEEKELIEFEKRMKWVSENTKNGMPAYETEVEKEARIKLLLGNYEQFCLYYFPNYCFAPLGFFHKEAAEYMYTHPNTIGLFQWSREFGKSTHFTFMFPLFLYFNDELTGMIAASANGKIAERLLIDIRAAFQANHRLIHDFGEQKSYGTWEASAFVTKRNVGFYAFGRETSPRGVRFESKRPNYAAIDDLNDKKTLKNDDLSNEDFEWVKEDVAPALSTKKWWIAVPQNKFHKNCVTSKYEESGIENVYLSRVNALNEEGESNYPENFSTQELTDKIAASGEISGQREYMNNPIEEGKVFKLEDIRYTKILPYKDYDVLVAYSDPSYTNNAKSDYKATGLLGKIGKKYHLLKVWIDRVPVATMFRWHYDFDELVGDHALVNHSMESNFIQGIVHFAVLQELAIELDRMLRINGDDRSKPDKFQRITSMQPLFAFGLIEFNEAEKDSKGMKRLVQQLIGFERGNRLNDDGPDMLESGITLAETLAVTNVAPIYIPRTESKYSF
jgi:phage terminase large subunit-like protein